MIYIFTVNKFASLICYVDIYSNKSQLQWYSILKAFLI